MIALLLLVFPLLEIATFVIVGSEIGVLATVGLVIAGAVAGLVLLRVRGVGALARAQAELRAGRDPGPQLVSGVITVVAALLLLMPGFLTDAVGLLLLIPAVRGFAWRLLKRRIAVSGDFATFRGSFGSTRWTGPRSEGRDRVIDLDEGDYTKSRPNPRTPWRLDSDDTQ